MDIEKIKNLAERANKPVPEIQALYDKNCEFFAGKGLSKENAEERALIRTELSLKKLFLRVAKTEETPGFILGKAKAFDMVAKIREKTRLFIESNGLEKAILQSY
jgi:hypothetical protein